MNDEDPAWITLTLHKQARTRPSLKDPVPRVPGSFGSAATRVAHHASVSMSLQRSSPISGPCSSQGKL